MPKVTHLRPRHPNRQAAAVQVPAPVARLFREAGITQETLRRCEERDRYWLQAVEAEAAARGLAGPVTAAMEAAGVGAILEASGP